MSCIYCRHHETLNDGRVGDCKCNHPAGKPKQRLTMGHIEHSNERFNINDIEDTCEKYERER